jgi:CheY-like chemotaxis protein
VELLRYRDGLETLVAERTAALSESNRELAVARDKAEAANLAKSAFLANMSHELRTPLSAILGFSQLLEMNAAAGMPDEYRLSVDHILKNGRHLLALINDLLDLAKIDAGQVSIRLECLDLAELLAGLKASLLPLAEAAGITISMPPGDALPPVRADETRLNQVLLNLGSNAIKYNQSGGKVEITCRRQDSASVRVVVADTGPGIPEERRNELFEPFNRLGRETGAIEGTGIGLALSRRLMHLMGGSIGFSGGADGGSRFQIDIPVYLPEEGGEGGSHQAPRPVPGRSGQASFGGDRMVLCVDDSRAGLELVAQVIGGIPGTSLLTAGTAEAGIELARRHRPALILMDINLPGMDGFAALNELRRYQETREIPVFALSAAATASDVARGLAAGFEQYLTKPYDIRDLVAVVGGKFAAL